MTAQLPDAAPSNWVDRHAPPAMQPWLKLGRFDRPAGIWLLFWPCLFGAFLSPPAGCWRWWPLFLGAGRTVGDARRRCVSCAAGRPDTRHAHAVPPARR